MGRQSRVTSFVLQATKRTLILSYPKFLSTDGHLVLIGFEFADWFVIPMIVSKAQ